MMVEEKLTDIKTKKITTTVPDKSKIKRVKGSIDNTPESQIEPTKIDNRRRVTFNDTPQIIEIDKKMNNPKKKKSEKFEIKDKTIIMSKRMMKIIKAKARKFNVMVPSDRNIILKYRTREELESDLRSMGLKPKTYIENKMVVYNLGYKETEKSVLDYFKTFGEVDKVVLEKNKKGYCLGKATVTFCSSISGNNSYKLNNRILRIERIKKQNINRNRVFISHMDKNIKISDMRRILKQSSFVPKNIRIDLQDGKNRGYGFVEFETGEESAMFIEKYKEIAKKIGKNSFCELSKEKDAFMDR